MPVNPQRGQRSARITSESHRDTWLDRAPTQTSLSPHFGHMTDQQNQANPPSASAVPSMALLNRVTSAVDRNKYALSVSNTKKSHSFHHWCEVLIKERSNISDDDW